MRARILVALVVTGTLASGLARAQDATGVLMKKADRLYARCGEGKAADAVTAYEKVLAVDGQSLEARWKLARTYYWIGWHAADSSGKLTAYDKGIRHAQDAIALDAKCAPCHFWLGVSYGMYGQAKGMMQGLGLVPNIKDAMNLVLKLDPAFEYSGANRVLGRLYHQLPRVSGGDNAKAIVYLQKACADSPTHPMNCTFLAEVLLDEGRADEAKKALEATIGTPESSLPPDTVADMKAELANARKLYEKRFGKLP
jgi:tetratricopeptide (TPR) repeat protein